MRTKKILVVYHQHRIPLRNTILKYIKCFEKYSNYEVFYCNCYFKCPFYLKKISLDLIIFDTSFLIIRTYYQKFIKLIAKIKLKKIFYTNIAVYYTKRVIQLINK